jgi:hypothetical protein
VKRTVDVIDKLNYMMIVIVYRIMEP